MNWWAWADSDYRALRILHFLLFAAGALTATFLIIFVLFVLDIWLHGWNPQ